MIALDSSERQNMSLVLPSPPLTAAFTSTSPISSSAVGTLAVRDLVPFVFPDLQAIPPKEVRGVSLRQTLFWPRTTHGSSQVGRVRASAVVFRGFNCFIYVRILVIEIGLNVVYPEIDFVRMADVDALKASDFAECGIAGYLRVGNVHTNVPQILASSKQSESPFWRWIVVWPVKNDRLDLLTIRISDFAEESEKIFGATKAKTVLAVKDMEGFEMDLSTDPED